jgi:hypothetical protein
MDKVLLHIYFQTQRQTTTNDTAALGYIQPSRVLLLHTSSSMSVALNLSSIEAICHVLLLLM